MSRQRFEFKRLFTGLTFFMAILFSASMACAGSATLSWTSPTTNTDGSPITDLAGYKIYYGTASGVYTTTVNVTGAGQTTYTINNLGNGTYYFVMTAYDLSANESAYSNEVSKTVSATDTTPPVISGVYQNNVSTTGATVNWTTNELSDSQVQYGTTTSYGSTTTLNTTLSTSHSQALSGLQASMLYHYRVLGKDSSGNQATSGDYTFTTTAPPAPVISNMQAKNITASTATITWTTNVPSTSQVNYGMTSSYGYTTPLDTNLTTSHSVAVSGLAGFTTYDFRVRSKDAYGTEAVSSNSTFTTSNTPPTVSSLAATPTTGYAPLAVSFSASATDNGGYIASYKWDFDGDGVYDRDTGTVPSASHTYQAAGTYNAVVSVTDNGGSSVVSNAITVKVSTVVAQPPTVTSVAVTPSSGTAPMSVTFTANVSTPDSPIVKYEWDFNGNGTYDVTTTNNPVTYIYTSDGDYTAHVRVTDNNGATATGNAEIIVTAGVSTVGSTVGSTGTASSGQSIKGGCFIATAAFGSYLDPHVMVLRDFRDNFLLTNTPGTYFVKLYYSVSPPIADYIARHEAIKLAVRYMLTPIVFGLEYSKITIIIFVLTTGFVVYIRRNSRRQRRQPY